ncbi:hypothetical protein ACFL27_16555 [candidate division CSSED10-310 bacterium]|uniref:Glycosyltransferase RgtA/B/C/D-like domain-containing protein n=1 Tax=candidate division CSSED10-310 bacterium TaxID=2855610 RepID=A0ABV6Z029_UNCC1
MSQGRHEPLALIILAIGCSFVLVTTGLAVLVAPLGDSYHYEMPAFWIQHQTIAPFVVHNPRIISVSFAGEALALPGHMYLRGPAIMFVLTLLASLLIIWIVYSLARQLGCSFGQSLCAAALTPAYGTMALSIFINHVDLLWTGVWSGACLMFLVQCRSDTVGVRKYMYLLGIAVYCFALACGTKNITLLSAPLFALCLVLLGRQLWRPRLLAALAVLGLGGMIISGMLWNYTANQIWFGDFRGSTFMREHVSSDLSPVAIWTRSCRGMMILLFDTEFVPASMQSIRRKACKGFLQLMGANHVLAEDEGFYQLNETSFAPRQGLGLLGIVFFMPGVAVGTVMCMKRRQNVSGMNPFRRRKCFVLVLFCTGTFLFGHAFLRWQSIGILRLLPLFLIAGAPLCAFLFGKRWLRLVALVMLLVSTWLYGVFMIGMTVRRVDLASGQPWFAQLARLQQVHNVTVDCQWKNDPVEKLAAREVHYTKRELYLALLRYLPKPVTIGVVGGSNTEIVWLFGPHYQNRIIPLVDCRQPERVLAPPEKCQFVVVDGKKVTTFDDWAAAHGFLIVFQATQDQKRLLAVYERKP